MQKARMYHGLKNTTQVASVSEVIAISPRFSVQQAHRECDTVPASPAWEKFIHTSAHRPQIRRQKERLSMNGTTGMLLSCLSGHCTAKKVALHVPFLRGRAEQMVVNLSELRHIPSIRPFQRQFHSMAWCHFWLTSVHNAISQMRL